MHKLRLACFSPARYRLPDEQDGDRSACARSFADERGMRRFPREHRQGLHHLCRSDGRQRDHHVHARYLERAAADPRFDGASDDGTRRESGTIIINDLKNATYYARMIIRAENELSQKKIVELDARPSDCIAMATQQKAPIYVSQEVWDEVDDMSDVLRKMEEEGLKPAIRRRSTEGVERRN